MKSAIAMCGMLLIGAALADAPVARESSATQHNGVHRYVIERTFAPGVLDKLDENGAKKIDRVNAKFGVHWVMSYANPDKTKTFCIYEGPDEAAIRESARANGIPVDSVTEVPVTLLPPVQAASR